MTVCSVDRALEARLRSAQTGSCSPSRAARKVPVPWSSECQRKATGPRSCCAWCRFVRNSCAAGRCPSQHHRHAVSASLTWRQQNGAHSLDALSRGAHRLRGQRPLAVVVVCSKEFIQLRCGPRTHTWRLALGVLSRSSRQTHERVSGGRGSTASQRTDGEALSRPCCEESPRAVGQRVLVGDRRASASPPDVKLSGGAAWWSVLVLCSITDMP